MNTTMENITFQQAFALSDAYNKMAQEGRNNLSFLKPFGSKTDLGKSLSTLQQHYKQAVNNEGATPSLKETLKPSRVFSQDVKDAQNQLISLDYDTNGGRRGLGKSDGLFGKNTTAAVKKFQEKNDLDVNGTLDSDTRNALQKAVDNKVIKPNRKFSNDVKVAQNQLILLGFDTNGGSRGNGRSDGLFGKNTTAAVKQFQEKNGLDVSGNLDKDTRELLEQRTLEKDVQAKLKYAFMPDEEKLANLNGTPGQKRYLTDEEKILAKEHLATLEQEHGLPKGLLHAVMHEECTYDLSAKNRSSGAAGCFQFIPRTAAAYDVKDPYNFKQSAEGAAKMFSDLSDQYNGNLKKMLAGYNWGSGNIARKGMNNMPRETRDYIRDVTKIMRNDDVTQTSTVENTVAATPTSAPALSPA